MEAPRVFCFNTVCSVSVQRSRVRLACLGSLHRGRRRVPNPHSPSVLAGCCASGGGVIAEVCVGDLLGWRKSAVGVALYVLWCMLET